MKKAITIIVIFLILVSIGVLVLYKMLAQEVKVDTDKLKDGSYLYVDLSREYPERNDFNFSFFMNINKAPLAFYRLIEAVDYAASDDKIKAMVIIGSVNRLNRAQTEELYEAIKRFGENKKIYGYTEYLTMGNAVLLSNCDSIFMPEVGDIIMPGISIQPFFYKGLFDKIGVGFDVIQAGKYKGGMETFVRKEFSEPFEKSIEVLLDDIYDFYKVRITEARGLPEYQFDSLVSKAIIYGDDVLKSGLVDAFMYRNDIERMLEDRIEGLTEDEEFDDYKISIKKYANGIKNKMSYTKKEIALIIAEGNIMPGSAKENPFGREDGIFSTTLSNVIDDAADDDDIKAVVLRINSGGGSALASDIIWNSIVRAKEKKPFIVSMSGAAASGGYYIAMAADTIFAGNTTITGSIGVYGAKPYIKGLLEKADITKQVFKRGEHARIYNSIDRPWNDEERKILEGSIDNMYEDFITKAADGRNMAVSDMDSVAQGRVWSGEDAVQQGIVDANGGLWDAIKYAQKSLKIPLNEHPKIKVLPKQKTLFEMLYGIEEQAAKAILPEFYTRLKEFENQNFDLLQYKPGEALMICPIEVVGDNPIH
ncbi:MAG: signal peptide peptidase SppA [Candidatus Zixiibacteriota bacterium]